ncbi:MAG: XrtA system polysaccharide chain length determinant [Gammaproteobacteria bacterium]
MEETIDQVKNLFRSFWENRWLALMAAILFSIIGWVAVIVTPDRYEVASRVYVDTRSMLKPLLANITVESSVTESTAEIMKRTLLSRPNLEIVASRSGLDKKVSTSRGYEKMLKKLSEKIMIGGGKEENNIYSVIYTHSDPIVAKNVVQTLLDLFIEKVVSANRLDTDVSKRFLDEKIAEYEVKLQSAEQRLVAFKKEHPGVIANDDRTYYTRLEAMKTQLQTARLDLQEREHRRTALEKQLSTTPSYTTTGGGVIGGVRQSASLPIDINIMTAQAELDGLLLKYSEAHPDVSSAKRRLQQLQAQKSAGVTGVVANTGGGNPIRTAPVSVANPAYQTLKLAYGEADAMVAALKTRVSEYEKRLVEMEASVDTLPDIEAKLASLDRDYSTNKVEHAELLKRREAASLTEDVNNTDKLQFEIINPPRVPLTPIGPNRFKWLTMVFLLALAAGVGGAIFLSLMRPKIYNKQSIKQLTTLPVLGNVSQLNSVGSHLAKGAGNISYSLASGVLLLVYATLMCAYLFDVDYVRDYAGFGIEQVEEQIEGNVASPIKEMLE